ncbi:MAG: bifunctional 3-(3-hydroxy-phenyl)propionate/3-hydroxycinnamic acid hydroxylase, partial [Geminicoccaceae bacterium]
TGATLAALLGLQGVSVLVLEREAEIYDLPRAVHFDDETMRVFQGVGIADHLKDKVIINPGARFVDCDGKVLVDWPRPTAITENGWHASYRFHQPDLERILRAKLASIGDVDVRLGHLVDGLEDHGSHVSISYWDRQKGRSGKARARCVVGCDGARSTVRDAMQTPMSALGFEQRWLVVDVLLNRDKLALGRHTLQFCSPERPATYCCNVGLRRRWEFALLDGEQDADMLRQDTVWACLKRWIGPDDAELERIAIYTFKSEVAEAWVKGRLLLAGDAAHLTPPFMGQGLCAGIRDAANLAWKLAYSLKRRDDGALLATYESERKPHVTHYIKTAARMGAIVNELDAGIKSLPDIQSYDGTVHLKSVKRPLGPGLGDPDDKNRGMLFPQFICKNGERSDELVGHAFFLAIDRRGSVSGGWPPEGQTLCCEAEPNLKTALASIDAHAAVVRPDKHILASTNDAETIEEMLNRARDVWS